MSYDTFIKSQFFNRKSSNLSKLGFDFNGDTLKEYVKVQSMIYSLYHIRGESMLTIMKMFDIPSTRTMDIIFHHFDIQSRTLSEASSNANETGRSQLPTPEFKIIYHTTWDNKIVHLRSTYELHLAKQLDQSEVTYEVECLRIKYFDTQENRYRIAIPDFYLPTEHKIIEVKCDYWLDKVNMRDKQKSYFNLGYKFSLYLDFEFVDSW